MLPMVACVISLDSPTIILARKSLYSDLGGSLTLPPLWEFTCSVKIFQVHGIRFIIKIKHDSLRIA